ncbi:hypothetical protein BZG36_00973 [Bifiguratus adelaidae]|uniref:Cytochrome P450 n=1 Tax=Bifiguratus adelaidae TaxID=1938954 RepID=A0A261Y6E7_9FUNG|nr:hypothetical protein BZG36_00973 [Bifiguratus adelaidae]
MQGSSISASIKGTNAALLGGSVNIREMYRRLLSQMRSKTGRVGIAITLFLIGFLLKRKSIREPKGFKSIPSGNSGVDIWYIITGRSFRERYEAGMKSSLEDKGIVKMRSLFSTVIVQLATPEYAKLILTRIDLFPKSIPAQVRPYSLFNRFMGGVNLVFSNGDVWRRHRKVANPAFHKSWDTKVFALMADRFCAKVESTPDYRTAGVEVDDLFKRLTLDALGLAVFGYDFESIADPDGKYVVAYNGITKGMAVVDENTRKLNYLNAAIMKPQYFLFPFLDKYPFGSRLKEHRQLNHFDSLIYRLIDERREQLQNSNTSSEQDDLLTLMIKACFDEENPGQRLSVQELRDNMMIFFVAGHDTTAHALACTLGMLALHPEVQDKARLEVLTALGEISEERPWDYQPTIKDIQTLPYLNCVIKEILRLYPPLTMLPMRVAAKDIDLQDGYVIPEGTPVFLNIYSIHHNKRYWGDNADSFWPERFLQDDSNNARFWEWLPFSNGSRSCIGSQFSLIEQRVVLSTLLKRFEFSLPSDSPHRDGIKFSRGFFEHPAELKIIFKRRRTA